MQLGPDGCPITVEWTCRVFVPMLEALGPKYAATTDCFLRNLQLYGSTPAQLLGLPNKGTLEPGADADLLLLEPRSLAVRACLVGGSLTWADEQLHGALWYHT